MKNKAKFFGDAGPEYRWAARQGYGTWCLFVNKPTWDPIEKRWFDLKSRRQQCSFFPSGAPDVDAENSLIKRYSSVRCC